MSDLWGKAQEAADDARLLLRAGRYNGACNRAYYAMFNAARALLVEKEGIELSAIKRHATLLRLFSLHFIDKGIFAADFGPLLRRAADARLVADYDASTVGQTEAQSILDAMERFLTVADAAKADAKPEVK
ncbi:MAG: HEPN domain-containing protein [Pseudorhodoplanes sp.]|nr:HEPN domain-containing protein [Pseudorhodoplanes sp.]